MQAILRKLPANKQQELQEVVQLIRQHAEVEIIILFGSYARGDWQEELFDDGIHFKYQSDFDLLVIVETPSLTRQSKLESNIETEIDELTTVQTPVSIIVHDVEFVNRRLLRAQYFFSDIKKEGVVLYDSSRLILKESRPIQNAERHKTAKEDFEYWFNSAKEFSIDFENAFKRGSYNNAAFMLHQATEKLYDTVLLVFTNYKPNTHNLDTLRKLVNTLDTRFFKAFPLNDDEEKRLFKLLCKAYVDARYNKNYRISKEELTVLAQQVNMLEQCVQILCQEKIAILADSNIKSTG